MFNYNDKLLIEITDAVSRAYSRPRYEEYLASNGYFSLQQMRDPEGELAGLSKRDFIMETIRKWGHNGLLHALHQDGIISEPIWRAIYGADQGEKVKGAIEPEQEYAQKAHIHIEGNQNIVSVNQEAQQESAGGDTRSPWGRIIAVITLIGIVLGILTDAFEIRERFGQMFISGTISNPTAESSNQVESPNLDPTIPSTEENNFEAIPELPSLPIVFVAFDGHDREIYMIDPTSGVISQMTFNEDNVAFPSISPDGQKIAFSMESNSNYDIYVLTVATKEIEQLTDNPAQDQYPSWSPDGTKLAFASRRAGDHWDIYIMNSDGSRETNITNYPLADDISPAWSPNGDKIAFTSFRNDDTYGAEIFVLSLDDPTNPTSVTNSIGDDQYPSWSPDGKTIVFETNRNNAEVSTCGVNCQLDIYSLSLALPVPSNLTPNTSSNEYFPVWSNSQNDILFITDRDSALDIYILNIATNELTALNIGLPQVTFPDW